MSIQDLGTTFRELAAGRVNLISVTMNYLDGGKRELLAFRVTHPNGGAATTIEHEHVAQESYPASCQAALDKALAWVAKCQS